MKTEIENIASYIFDNIKRVLTMLLKSTRIAGNIKHCIIVIRYENYFLKNKTGD